MSKFVKLESKKIINCNHIKFLYDQGDHVLVEYEMGRSGLVRDKYAGSLADFHKETKSTSKKPWWKLW